MDLSQKKTDNFIKIMCACLLLLSVAAAVIKCLVGFDIDEGYAVSMPYRLLQGDHLFLDMWEVHQTSSFLPAFFLWIFEKVTGGFEGCVLYLRVIATLIHGGISFFLYEDLKKKTDTSWALLLTLLYFNLLPKWLISLDFSMQQVWGLTLILLLLERGRAFALGIVLAMTVLAYPGMVLSYPALLAALWQLNKKEEVKTRINKCIYMTLGCALMAAGFFAWVLSAMGLKEFAESIPMVFMDGTHQFSFGTKLLVYGRQWLNVAKQLLILSAPSLLITCVIYKTAKKKKTLHCGFGLLFLLAFLTVTSLLVIGANLVGIQMGPFHFQVRYLMFFAFGVVWSISCLRREASGENRSFFYGPMLQMLVAFAAILVFSNVGPDSSSSYLGIALVYTGVMIYKKTTVMNCGSKCAAYGVLALFVLSLIFCKGYYVRITEYGPSTIREERMQVKEGPVKGIYVLKEDYHRMSEDYAAIQNATTEKDVFLYLGTEGISNLYGNCKFVSPSTISTPAFNEQWVKYFETYPDKEPTVIALAKNTVDDREKFFAKNPLGLWIAGSYDVEHMSETESLCIIKKK